MKQSISRENYETKKAELLSNMKMNYKELNNAQRLKCIWILKKKHLRK